jgi:SAM-dependent methyltransferase
MANSPWRRGPRPPSSAEPPDPAPFGPLEPAGRAGEVLARFYDLDLEDDPGDLDLYLALAQRTGGPILELGAGTGRLAVPLAAAGYQVTAVDHDPAMLARAQERAQAAGLAHHGGHRGGLNFVEADLLALDLPAGRSFGLAFIALGSILLLATRDRQRAAFQVLARHLAPGGVAAVDAWLPAVDDLAGYDGRLALENVRQDPETGRLVAKLTSARHDAAGQQVTLTTIYEAGRQGQAPDRWLRTDRLRLLSVDELVVFAKDAGLVVERVAGSYDLDPIGPGSERAILIAARP